jgi:hypothetical protein
MLSKRPTGTIESYLGLKQGGVGRTVICDLINPFFLVPFGPLALTIRRG